MIELKKKTKVNRLTLDTNRRMIFVSDMHGDLITFKEGLEEIGFNDNDYLFVIGDMYEKGDLTYNLKTARYFMELNKKENVFCMSGNCDEVLRFILPKEAHKDFLYYTLVRQRSIINDMALEMKYPLGKDMDIDDFVSKVQEKYKDLYEFMDSLDDVIVINDKLVLVHGGLDDINNIPEYALPMLKYDNYYMKANPQKHITIVGHNPTRNYRSDVACQNPILDFKKKIFSIDGGNHLVKGGQINFLVLDNLASMKFSYLYVDHYEKHVMNYTVSYDEPEDKVNFTYGTQNEIKVLEKDLDFYYVKDLRTKVLMWVQSSNVFESDGRYYCYEGSNTFLSVIKGDVVSIIKRGKPYSVIKKNGYVGLIETKYLEYDL